MRYKFLSLLLLMAIHPPASPAQGSGATSLTDQQKTGQRIFQQRCSVCHTLPTIQSTKTYGPALYKELVNGNEDRITEFIRSGSPGKMPGFRYGLEPKEIEAIVEYLKTVDRPRPPGKASQ